MRKLTFLFAVLLLASVVYGQQCNNGETRQCGLSDVGECSYGTQTCISSEWGICQGAKYPRSEECFDNLDNDCDGSVDENCDCVSGSTRSCGYSGKGICRFGTETCVDNFWAECKGAVYPELTDLCSDNLDNDCDGLVDEDCQALQGTCFDKIKNQGETGIDCGGPCPTCGTCSDGVKNQNEVGVDCGGVCPVCATCSDRIQNQGEEDIDCGGPCQPCVKEEESDDDQDTLTYQQEIALGTDPGNPDSDFDKVQDNLDKMPLCPNNFCDSAYGETEVNCPEDCKAKATFSFWPLIVIGGLLVLAVLVYFLRIRKKSDGKTSIASGSSKKGPTKIVIKDVKQKARKTKVEEALEKSLEKSSKMFKK